MAGLRQYRRDSSIDIALPFSLVESSLYRLALVFALELARREPHNFLECAKIASKALTKYSPTIEEINAGIEITKAQSLPPEVVALIGSKITNLDARSHFFDKYFCLHACRENTIALIKAFAYRFTGDVTKALGVAQELVKTNPHDTEACNLAATILVEHDYTYEARRYACLSLRYKPNQICSLELLGLSLYKEGRWKAARRIFKVIHAQLGDDISLVNSLITLPPLTLKAGELGEAVNGFYDLKKLLGGSPKLIGVERSLEFCKVPLPSEFYLAYQGPFPIRNNLEAARDFTRLSAKSLLTDIVTYHKRNTKKVDKSHATSAQKEIRKIKIGFISRFFSNHSNSEAHSGLIEQLNRHEFLVYVIHRPGTVIDGEHTRINKLADKVIYLKEDFGSNCRSLARLGLDILFFTDIGMISLDSVLAMAHLARFQITSWGLPHTTGVREIDFYLRSSIFEDCEGPDEYSEKLIELNGYLGYFSHDQYELNALSRDYFLLPPDRFLIGCLQALHKIHPEFDSYLEEIAKIHDSILIIISPTESDTQMRRFIDRIKTSAPVAYSRLCILQRTTRADFFSLNNILDLNLDTIYYGAGISFLDTAWCGPPYITQRSNLVKGSVVSRSYEYAGIDNPPVARSKEEYIDLVKFYFNNRDQLRSLRKEIHLKSEGTIYNDWSYVKAYEEFFKGLLE
jgi:hypothetical protein